MSSLSSDELQFHKQKAYYFRGRFNVRNRKWFCFLLPSFQLFQIHKPMKDMIEHFRQSSSRTDRYCHWGRLFLIAGLTFRLSDIRFTVSQAKEDKHMVYVKEDEHMASGGQQNAMLMLVILIICITLYCLYCHYCFYSKGSFPLKGQILCTNRNQSVKSQCVF